MEHRAISRKGFHKRKLVLPALYENLHRIGEFVNLASREAGFDDSDAYKVQLAVDEACSNIIEHAYGGEDARQEIVCTCLVTDNVIKIRLHDHGRAFDPEKIPIPDVNAALGARATGGLGLFFMRQLMDKVDFRFTPGPKNKKKDGNRHDHGNLLILTKLRKNLA